VYVCVFVWAELTQYYWSFSPFLHAFTSIITDTYKHTYTHVHVLARFVFPSSFCSFFLLPSVHPSTHAHIYRQKWKTNFMYVWH
jgi:hypothetical protein